jgi:hypothetical protein
VLETLRDLFLEKKTIDAKALRELLPAAPWAPKRIESAPEPPRG